MKPWAFWGNVRLPFLDQSSGDLGVMEVDGMVKYVFGYYSYQRTPKIMIKVPLTPQIFLPKYFSLMTRVAIESSKLDHFPATNALVEQC